MWNNFPQSNTHVIGAPGGRRGRFKTFKEKGWPNFKCDENYKLTVLRNSMNSKQKVYQKTTPWCMKYNPSVQTTEEEKVLTAARGKNTL